MVDLFDEVEEQLRTDRYKSAAFKAAPWVTGVMLAVLAAALGYWGWESWQSRSMLRASESYDAALEALGQQDETGAFTKFGEVIRTAPPAYKVLAMIQQGGIRLDAGKTAEAVALFDQAAKEAPTPLLADAAAMRSVYALMDDAPYDQMERRLTPLMATGRPYRMQAKEALAVAKLAAGKTEEAKADFQIIATSLDSPEDMQGRARAAIALINTGASGTLTATVRAAATLPPPAAPNFMLPPGGPQGAEGGQPGTPQ